MSDLTQRQRQVLEFIDPRCERVPAERPEIGEAVGSVGSTVHAPSCPPEKGFSA
jgi:hypothetical protein